MSEESDSSLVVGLDIGSSKVVTVIGERAEDGTIKIDAVDVQPSRGVKQGMINNLDHLTRTIESSIRRVEHEAECEIRSLSTTITGAHIRGEKTEGMCSIRRGNVTDEDRNKVLETAGAFALPEGEEVLHVMPTEYLIDQQGGIRNPIGMAGVRLEARVHLVVASSNAIQNLKNCVEQFGLALDHAIFQGLASSAAILSEDEKNLGVCVIDIGAGTTDIVAYKDGAVIYSESLAIAGESVTRDIVKLKRLSSQVAESIKIEYGSCAPDLIGVDERVPLPLLESGKEVPTLSRRYLADIIESRYEELFDLVKARLDQNRINYTLGAGIVLTGGGALAKNVESVAKSVFSGVPVRIGAPNRTLIGEDNELVDNPKYSAVVGLLLANQPNFNFWQKELHKSVPKRGIFSKLYDLIRKNF